MHSEMNSDSLVKIDGVFGYFFCCCGILRVSSFILIS